MFVAFVEFMSFVVQMVPELFDFVVTNEEVAKKTTEEPAFFLFMVMVMVMMGLFRGRRQEED